MLSPRTILNGGERGQEHVREVKKRVEDPSHDPNGADLVRSTFLVLTFTFTLAFMVTLVLAFILAFFSPFGGSIFTLLWCNGEKGESGASVGSSLRAFGWAFARAYGGLRRRFAFHWSCSKPA